MRVDLDDEASADDVMIAAADLEDWEEPYERFDLEIAAFDHGAQRVRVR